MTPHRGDAMTDKANAPQGGVTDAMAVEGWHSAINDAHEISRNSTDARIVSRAYRMVAYLNANRAALQSQAPERTADDWYTDEEGVHNFDLDDDPERQLSILLKPNGKAGFAIYAQGQRFYGSVWDASFREGLRALSQAPDVGRLVEALKDMATRREAVRNALWIPRSDYVGQDEINTLRQAAAALSHQPATPSPGSSEGEKK